MNAYLHCLSHSPLVGYVDPAPAVLAEVEKTIADARQRIQAFDPELVILFAPDHYNGFFYDIMPPFCIGMAATAIGDFSSAAGELPVPAELAEACAQSVLDAGVDVAVSYCMQVDHGFAQPLEYLLGGLDKRVLILGSGGLSHQPPVPQLAGADAHMRDRLLGSGRQLPADERQLRQHRVITAARAFVRDQSTLHPLNPVWDNQFMDVLSGGQLAELDGLGNDELSAIAGRSTHEVKAWMAAFAALSAFGPYQTEGRYYRELPEWITGFGSISAAPRK